MRSSKYEREKLALSLRWCCCCCMARWEKENGISWSCKKKNYSGFFLSPPSTYKPLAISTYKIAHQMHGIRIWSTEDHKQKSRGKIRFELMANKSVPKERQLQQQQQQYPEEKKERERKRKRELMKLKPMCSRRSEWYNFAYLMS